MNRQRPKRFHFSAISIWSGLIFPLMLAAIWCTYAYAPTEKQMGDVQRIFYFHAPLAWVAFLAFAMTCVFSILYLAREKRHWDAAAAAAAEIGVVFCALVLVTGTLWARAAWNTWWTWDSRLTTTLILFMIYLAYLILRQAYAGNQAGPRMAAVLGIVGFVDVPIVFMAVRWWRTIHPAVLQGPGWGMEPAMLTTLLINLAAFTLLFFLLLALRVRMGLLEERIRAAEWRRKA